MAKQLWLLMTGLGGEGESGGWSDGIANEIEAILRAIPGCEVHQGSYRDFARFSELAKQAPPGTRVNVVGHSLGASSAPELCRRAGREIHAIFGFDAADNLGANISIYRLTRVPRNVRYVCGVYVPGGALGGGGYEAEYPYHPELRPEGTRVENHPMEGATHGNIDNAVREHFAIQQYALRQSEA